jgi:glycosyltransferase involved in cell wall biosynthesis
MENNRGTDPRVGIAAAGRKGSDHGGVMRSSPEISVLMSVRNGHPHLARAVASILAQTFSDFEFVIVDNASDDGSAEYVDAVARRDARIALLRNERDLGHSGGLNRGLAECRGEWVARMDADDVAMPGRLARQLAFVRENPDVEATSCVAWYIDGAGRRAGRTVVLLATREDFERFRRENVPIALLHPGAFIRRSLFQSLGGYRGEFDPANDVDLWCRIADRHLILTQPEPLMEYRIHGASVSASKFEHGRLKQLWARDSMIARRAGQAEPSWEQFLAGRRAAPWWTRLDRWRRMNAKRLYRQAAQDHLGARHIRSVVEMAAATALQPEYTLPRLRVQRLG